MLEKKFKKLYDKGSRGKIKYWEISVEGADDESSGLITIKFGADGEKERSNENLITSGKNVGRANETTPYAQACLEAESKWKKQLDKGYVENISNVDNEILLPMLAQRFQDRKHDIIYPCIVQPKLDGVRVLAKRNKNDIIYLSRKGKEYTTLSHLTPDLLSIMKDGEVFDGEIYSHDMTFQELVSNVKKLREDSRNLEFHVFDIADTKMECEARLQLVLTRCAQIKTKNKKIKAVKYSVAQNEQHVYTWHNKFVEEGYEGVIIRNKKANYVFKKRVKDLQKYKEFIDEEFKITGGYPGTGTEEGCITFTVKNQKNQEFSVRPRGSFEQRREWMQTIERHIGKLLTVRYQELTDGGIPRFPVGIIIREDT